MSHMWRELIDVQGDPGSILVEDCTPVAVTHVDGWTVCVWCVVRLDSFGERWRVHWFRSLAMGPHDDAEHVESFALPDMWDQVVHVFRERRPDGPRD